MSIAVDHIEFVDNGGALLGGNQASAHVVNNGPGNDQLQIDVDGNGISDMEVSLQNVAGTLHNTSFLPSAALSVPPQVTFRVGWTPRLFARYAASQRRVRGRAPPS